MLPATARLRTPADFADVIRHGRRAGRRTLVVHLLADAGGTGDAAARVGFVVSRKVGGSVQRHRVTRQLRALMRDRCPALPAGARVVVRARPGAYGSSAAQLGDDLDRALARTIGGAG